MQLLDKLAQSRTMTTYPEQNPCLPELLHLAEDAMLRQSALQGLGCTLPYKPQTLGLLLRKRQSQARSKVAGGCQTADKT